MDQLVALVADAVVREGIVYGVLVHPVAMVGDLRPVVGDTSFQDWAQAAPLHVGRHRQLGIVEEGRREVAVRRDGLRPAGSDARRMVTGRASCRERGGG